MKGLLKVLAACLFCLAPATQLPAEQGPADQASLIRSMRLAVGVETTNVQLLPVIGRTSPAIEPCSSGGPIELLPIRVGLSDAGDAARAPRVDAAPDQTVAAIRPQQVGAAIVQVGGAVELQPVRVSTGGVGVLCLLAWFSAYPSDFGPAKLLAPVNIAEASGRMAALTGSEMFDPAAPNVPRLLALARAGQWQELAAVIMQSGGRSEVGTSPAPVEAAKPLIVDHLISGTIKPSDDPERLDGEVKRLLYWGLTPPIMRVADLKAGWEKVFDATFKAMEDGGLPAPIVELRLERMSTAEVLFVPAFLRRYHGRFHSVIVGYDFYGPNTEVGPGDARIRQGVQSVALTLELIHRTAPSVRAWLGVGYNSRPQWKDWLKTQDASRYDGIALFGGSAVQACSHPEVAKIVVDRIRQEAPNKPVALIGVSSYYHNLLMRQRDEQGIIGLRNLATRLKAAGLAFVGIQED